MKEKGYFVSHADGLVVIYIEWEDREDPYDSGYIVKKIYIDEEGFFTIQHKKRRTTYLNGEGLLVKSRNVIQAIFDPNKDSWNLD